MKKIITKEIDGFHVVVGIDRPLPDPESTKIALREAIAETDEQAAYIAQQSASKTAMAAEWAKIQTVRKNLLIQYAAYNPAPGVIDINGLLQETEEYKAWDVDRTDEKWAAVTARKKDMEARAPNFMSIINTFLFKTQDYADWLVFKKAEESKILAAVQAVNEKRKDIFDSTAVFFESKSGEKIISDEEAETVQANLAALKDNNVLKVDADLDPKSAVSIDNYKGGEYWNRSAEGVWTKTEITALDVAPPVDSVAKADLTAGDLEEIRDQAEQERIDAMTAEEKQAEYDSLAASALAMSAQKRSEYEIQGVEAAQALLDAQAWYNSELAVLQDKYGIEV